MLFVVEKATMKAGQETFVGLKVFRTIEPVIVVTRIFGLCPVIYRPGDSGYIIIKSRNFCIYSYILGFALTMWTTIGIIRDVSVDPKKSFRMDNSTRRYITCIDLGFIIVLAMIGILLTPIKFKYLLKIFNEIYKIDEILNLRTTNRSRKHSILVIFFVLVPFTILIIADIYLWIMQTCSNETPVKFLQNYLPFYITYVILINQHIFLWCLFDLIRKRFYDFGEIIASKIVLLQRLSKSQEILNCSKLSNPFITTKQIKDMRKVHELLCDSVDELSNFFGFNILLITSSCLLHLVITPYFLFLNLTIREIGVPFTITVQICWLITHICRIYFLVEPCHAALQENQKNLNMVYKLLNFNLSDNVRSEILVLTEQIANRKANFSCCGLFNIDKSILTNMGAAVTTYLVILFQFMGK